MNKMQQSPPAAPLNLVSTKQIQTYLDENKNLIMAILESQKMGKAAECAQYQAILQKNLMYLAAIADAQPPGSSTSSQIPASSLEDPQKQQQQPGGAVSKLRPHNQQNQLLQFQQQQMQGHFSGGGNNGNMMDAISGNGQGSFGMGREGRE